MEKKIIFLPHSWYIHSDTLCETAILKKLNLSHTWYIPYIGICYIRVTLLLSMIENCDVHEEEGEEEARHKIYNGTLWKVQNEITTLSPHHELKNFKKNVKR